MADQPLNAAKVEYLYIDLGGAATWLVPEAIVQIPTPRRSVYRNTHLAEPV
ncbi:MAG TPA: hypothetical protein VIH87_08765 [Methylocella sp.]